MDQINYDRRMNKKTLNSNLAMWEKPKMDKYLCSKAYIEGNKEFYMLAEDLKKESRDLAIHKKEKEAYDMKMKENYLKCLKKIYRFKEFVDETNFEKIFPPDQLKQIEQEMSIFAMTANGFADKMLDKPKKRIKKKELKLEYKDWEQKTSSSEMEESSDEEEAENEKMDYQMLLEYKNEIDKLQEIELEKEYERLAQAVPVRKDSTEPQVEEPESDTNSVKYLKFQIERYNDYITERGLDKKGLKMIEYKKLQTHHHHNPDQSYDSSSSSNSLFKKPFAEDMMSGLKISE